MSMQEYLDGRLVPSLDLVTKSPLLGMLAFRGWQLGECVGFAVERTIEGGMYLTQAGVGILTDGDPWQLTVLIRGQKGAR